MKKFMQAFCVIETLFLLMIVFSMDLEMDELKLQIRTMESTVRTLKGALEGDAEKDDVEVKVTGKRNIKRNIKKFIFTPQVELSVEIGNHGEKDIKGIQGMLTISDLFGKELKRFKCEFAGRNILKVNTYQTAVISDIQINSFSHDDVKFFKCGLDSLEFRYELSMIVYTDGTSKTFI